MVQAKQDVSASKQAVQTATGKLAESQTNLSRAQAALNQLTSQLTGAKAAKDQADADLAVARQNLQSATDAAASAADDVRRQQTLIGVAARTQYQQRTGLEGLGAIIGSQTPAELAQRVQWSAVIFNNTSAQFARLRQLQDQLDTAQQQQAAAEAQVEDRQQQAASTVAQVQSLTDQAAKQETQVAALVVANQKAQAAAQNELAVSQQQYDALAAKEAQISAAIKKAALEAKRAAAAKAAAARAAAKTAAEKEAADRLASGSASTSGLVRPVSGHVTSTFGMRFHPVLHVWRMHWGEDIGAPCGAPLRAMANGVVQSTIPVASSGGLGNYTIIDYGLYGGKDLMSGYGHQSKFLVSPGERVKAGQIVGLVGTTGVSTGCHVHVQIYLDGDVVNPAPYLS